MAKVKLAGSKKAKPGARSNVRAALPCLFLVVAGIALIALMFYLSLQPGTP